MLRNLSYITWFCVFCVSQIYSSESNAKSDGARINIGGLIFADYEYRLFEDWRFFDSNHDSRLHIDRVYLTVKAKLNDEFDTRITYDVSANVGSPDERLRGFIKHAYINYSGLQKHNLMIKAGLSPTGYIDYHDKFLGTRWLIRTISDRSGRRVSSDLGVNASGYIWDRLLDYQVGVFNGGGYKRLETSMYKEAEARLTFDPVAGTNVSLPMTLFWAQDLGSPLVGQEPGYFAAGAIGLKSPLLVLWGEYYRTRDINKVESDGYSVEALARLSQKNNFYLRFDYNDPDVDISGDSRRLFYAGLTHDFISRVSLGFCYQQERNPAVNPGNPQHTLFIKSRAAF